MGRRDSGRERVHNDLYETPAWVVDALLPHLPPVTRGYIWECAAGHGKIMDALAPLGVDVYGSDIVADHKKLILYADFLTQEPPVVGEPMAGIVTNPPYLLAQAFIERALALTSPDLGFVAMLLPSDFDAAQSRAHLFGGCPQFAKRVTLTRRIRWFDGPVICIHCSGTGAAKEMPEQMCIPCRGKGVRKPSPSENHCWFIWDHTHKGPATVGYGP